MKGADRLAAAVEDLAENLKANTEMMKTLRESVDDVRTEMQHALRNQQFYQENGPTERLVETVACENCDAGADSLQEAVGAGWLDLCEADDCLTSNFLGICPSCAKAEMEKDMERQRQAKAEQKGLF